MKKIYLSLLVFSTVSTVFAQYTDKDIYLYIENYSELAIKKMEEFKIPASITLAQGIFESACGTSRLATEGNNHFGIKCHKDWEGDTLLLDDDALGECFRKYEKVEQSYDDHSLFLTTRPRYEGLFKLDIMDYKAWAKGLKDAGYATNPKYAERLISLIERFGIAKQDTVWINRKRELPSTGELFSDKQERKEMKKEEKTTPSYAAQRREVYQEEIVSGYISQNDQYKKVSYPFTERQVYENNRTYFVFAREGDTYATIAKSVQDSEKNIRRYNDASRGVEPLLNEIVYIEQKSRNHPAAVHVVQQGETLKVISQKYGIQLQYIFKFNNLNANSIIHPNDTIKLKH